MFFHIIMMWKPQIHKPIILNYNSYINQSEPAVYVHFNYKGLIMVNLSCEIKRKFTVSILPMFLFLQ